MIEPVNTQKPLFSSSRVAEGDGLQEGEGGALGRRLITLLCADWVPHDSVFVAECLDL
jgi:hypothetical protein